MAFRLLPQAEADIEWIVFRIARDSPSAAIRWHEEILEKCRRLGDFPAIGRARPEVRPDLRTLTAGNYLIIHRQRGSDVDIVRVIHGARKWEDLL